MPALEHQIDKDVIWQMLSHIPAFDRDAWIKIGMALKAEFGDRGLSLFDEWSKQADNYEPKSVTSVWRSFKGGAVSIGSLVHLAKEHGWRSGSTAHGNIPIISLGDGDFSYIAHKSSSKTISIMSGW